MLYRLADTAIAMLLLDQEFLIQAGPPLPGRASTDRPYRKNAALRDYFPLGGEMEPQIRVVRRVAAPPDR